MSALAPRTVPPRNRIVERSGELRQELFSSVHGVQGKLHTAIVFSCSWGLGEEEVVSGDVRIRAHSSSHVLYCRHGLEMDLSSATRSP